MSLFSRLMNRSGDTKMPAADFVARYDGSAPVVDVRTPDEFAGGHLAGAANANVMAPDFTDQIEALSLPKEEPVYLYCRSGNRSGKATAILREKGYTKAVNIGGYEALKAAGAKVRL